jgi:protein tyrosine phosphatase (PTP) superfamily phosphohydrolase (DUF442 family)
MPLTHIKNFLVIDARIASAGQPTESEFSEVAAAGYSSVINLGLLDPRYCLPDEAGLVASLGMAYRHLPVVFDAPQVEDFEAFLKTMDEWRERRVLVHCAANYRVSSFLGLYGELRLGWSRERADTHARAFWEPNPVWLQLLAGCRERFLPAVTR